MQIFIPFHLHSLQKTTLRNDWQDDKKTAYRMSNANSIHSFLCAPLLYLIFIRQTKSLKWLMRLTIFLCVFPSSSLIVLNKWWWWWREEKSFKMWIFLMCVSVCGNWQWLEFIRTYISTVWSSNLVVKCKHYTA